jgi:hypothetical protein
LATNSTPSLIDFANRNVGRNADERQAIQLGGIFALPASLQSRREAVLAREGHECAKGGKTRMHKPKTWFEFRAARECRKIELPGLNLARAFEVEHVDLCRFRKKLRLLATAL